MPTKSRCCLYCTREFKYVRDLKNHEIGCHLKTESLKNALNEDEPIEVPRPEVLYRMVISLQKQINELKDENAELKQYKNKTVKKTNIIGYLNEHMKPDYYFDNMINTIHIESSDLEQLTTWPGKVNSACYGLIDVIFGRTIYKKQNVPIIALEQKNRTLYIYENDTDKWVILNDDRLSKFIDKVSVKLEDALYDLRKDNSYKYEHDYEFMDLCNNISQNIANFNVKNSRIKTSMYEHMKTNIPGLFE